MPKFMSSHTMPAGAMTLREQVDQIAQAAQADPVVKPYRSFLNLAEGKVFCVMEVPTRRPCPPGSRRWACRATTSRRWSSRELRRG